MKKVSASLFIVYLRFGVQRDRASQYTEQHVEWIRSGMDEGVFLCAGSLPDRQGGVILAYGLEEQALEGHLTGDPFVARGIVAVEIVPVSVGMVQEKAVFLADMGATP